MVSSQYFYAAYVAFSAALPQAAAHRRRASDTTPHINARLIDASGRALEPAEIASLSGRTLDLTISESTPSVLKRDELDERAILLVIFYIAAASEEDDAEAYADDLASA